MTEADSTLTRLRIPADQFGRYLRTGRLTHQHDAIEVKFNPWHDPRTGRFTFRGGGGTAAGTWGSGGFTGGGGGSFGGGGASASWDAPTPASARGKTQGKPVQPKPTAAQVAITAATQDHAVTRNGYTHQNHVVIRNGYTYTLDDADRTVSVSGVLTLTATQRRSRSAQAGAGGSDRLSSDDGGHYVAVRFNGPTDTFNHFAQDANFNRGGYRVLESEWAKDIRQGKQVYIAITPTYVGRSLRPVSIDVTYRVNGVRSKRSFSNLPKDKSHGK